MAAYSSNSVTIRVGSATVYGNNTDFISNADAGNIFKITNENVVYTVAAINTATRLTLSSRYANANEQVFREENVATVNSATKLYSGYFLFAPVLQDTVVVTASWKFTDDGGGSLTATGGSGTIDYDTGAYSIALTSDLSASKDMTASYYSGNQLNAVAYQLIRDYTPNYSFPESVPSDKNLAYIFTRAIRMIDTQLKVLEDRIASWH